MFRTLNLIDNLQYISGPKSESLPGKSIFKARRNIRIVFTNTFMDSSVPDLKRLPDLEAGKSRIITSYIEEARAKYDLELYEDSLALYEQALALCQNNSELFREKGDVLVTMLRFAEAIESYDLSIKQDPNNGNSYHNKAIALSYLGERFEEVVNYLDMAASLNSLGPQSYYHRALSLYQLQRYDEVLSDVEKALKEKANNKKVLYLQLASMIAVDDVNSAIDNYFYLRRLFPAEPETCSFFCSVLLSFGYLELALDVATRTTRIFDDADLYCAKGLILTQMRRYKEALYDLDYAILLDPNKGIYQVLRTEALFKSDIVVTGSVYANSYVISPSLPQGELKEEGSLPSVEKIDDLISLAIGIAPDLDAALLESNIRESFKAAERGISMSAIAPDKTGSATLLTFPPKLTKGQLAAFKLHAEKNQWDSDSGTPPSQFIRDTFKRWLRLKHGLPLADIRGVQENLASAYLKEIGRDSERQVAGLYVQPHRLPAGTPPRPRSTRRVADLTEEEHAERKKKNAAEKARSRAKQSKLVGMSGP